MKKIFVVFGVLVIFLFAALDAHAVENNTWGRIKATFSDETSIASGDLQLLPGEAFAEPLAKGAGRNWRTKVSTVSQHIKARKGGKVRLDLRWVKMEVTIKRGALERDMTLTLSVKQDEEGAPSFFVEGSEHQDCNPPAQLKIKINVLLSEVDPYSLSLMHQTYVTDEWEPVEGLETKVRIDRRRGTAEVEVALMLHGFSSYSGELDEWSRYSLARS